MDIVKDLTFKLDDMVSKEKAWLENFKAINFDTDHNKEIQKMLIDSHEMHITSKANVLEILKFAVETGQQKKELEKKSVKKKKQQV
jgi:hypothetical protein